MSTIIGIFITIITGVSVFVVGQIYMKFYIEPVHELQKCIGEITDILVYYCNVYMNPGLLTREELNHTQSELRRAASKLRAKNYGVRRVGIIISFERFIPSYEDVEFAVSQIIGLSNSVFDQKNVENNIKRQNEINKRLRIRVEQ